MTLNISALLAQLEDADASLVLTAAIALFALARLLLQALTEAATKANMTTKTHESDVVAPTTSAPTTKPRKLHRPASTLPLLGNTLDAMYFQQHRFFDWLVDETLASGAKPWVLSILGRAPTYVLSTPEAFEDVFKTHASVFEKGPEAALVFKDFLGEGIIAADGHKWLLQRKIVSRLFSTQMLRDAMAHVVAEKTLLVRETLKRCVERKQRIAVADLLTKYSSDVFARVSFGVELDCLKDPFATSPEHAFIGAIKSGARIMQQRFQQPAWLWRLMRFLNVGQERRAKQDVKVLHDFVHDTISRSLHSKSEALGARGGVSSAPSGGGAGDADAADLAATRGASGGDAGDAGDAGAAARRTATAPMPSPGPADRTATGKDLLSLFLESGEAEHAGVDFMRDMVLNFFAAGKDTTTLNMSWFLLMMNRHPRAAAKVRAELREQLPALVRGEQLVASMEDTEKLVYLEAALRESMRLNNSMTARCASEDVTLRDGTFIPRHANVIASIYVSARLPSVWGHDAAEYKPERWLDAATGKLVRFSPYQDITFLVGPRKCIGMRFAMLQMKILLATVLSQFDVRTVEDPFAVTYDFSFILALGSSLVSDVADAPGLPSSGRVSQ